MEAKELLLKEYSSIYLKSTVKHINEEVFLQREDMSMNSMRKCTVM